jgi:hypothetical protein
MLLVRICWWPARRGFAGSGGFGFRICLGFRIWDFEFPVLAAATGRVRISNLGFRISCLVMAAGPLREIGGSLAKQSPRKSAVRLAAR